MLQEFQPKPCKGISQKYQGTSHSTSEQGLEQFTVLLKLKSTFQTIARLAINFCFKNKQTLELFVPKIRTWVARSSPEKFGFEIPKQFHS